MIYGDPNIDLNEKSLKYFRMNPLRATERPFLRVPIPLTF